MSELQKWLVGVVSTVLLAWVYWVSSAVTQAIPRAEVEQRLLRIEQKLDSLLWRDYGRSERPSNRR